MNKEIFTSDRYFVVSDFLISHGQLLLRSEKAKGHGVNIDIIFFGTTYMQLFTYLHGVTIRIAKNKGDIDYGSVSSHLSYKDNYLFEIETGKGEVYYIAASFFKVYENELAFGETSLGVLHYKGREIEISSSL